MKKVKTMTPSLCSFRSPPLALISMIKSVSFIQIYSADYFFIVDQLECEHFTTISTDASQTPNTNSRFTNSLPVSAVQAKRSKGEAKVTHTLHSGNVFFLQKGDLLLKHSVTSWMGGNVQMKRFPRSGSCDHLYNQIYFIYKTLSTQYLTKVLFWWQINYKKSNYRGISTVRKG